MNQSDEKAIEDFKKIVFKVAKIVAVIIVCTFAYCKFSPSLHTTETGSISIRKCRGDIGTQHYTEGWHIQYPYCDFIDLSTQTHTMRLSGRNALVVNSRNQVPIGMALNVMWHLNPDHALSVYRAYTTDYENRVIDAVVVSGVRDAVSGYDALDINPQRVAVQNDIERIIRSSLAETLRQRSVSTNALIIDNILVSGVDLPDSLDTAIIRVQEQHQATVVAVEATQTARQEAERDRAIADNAAQVALVRARGQAAATLVESESVAANARARAQGEADANRLINASLTDTVLRARQIQAFQSVVSSNGTRTIFLAPGQQGPMTYLPVSQ